MNLFLCAKLTVTILFYIKYFLCEIHMENQIFLDSNLDCNYTFSDWSAHQTKFRFVHKSIKKRCKLQSKFWFSLTRLWKYFSASDEIPSCRQRAASNALSVILPEKCNYNPISDKINKIQKIFFYVKLPKVKISHQISKRYWNILLKVRRLLTKSKFGLINKVEKRFFCEKRNIRSAFWTQLTV